MRLLTLILLPVAWTALFSGMRRQTTMQKIRQVHTESNVPANAGITKLIVKQAILPSRQGEIAGILKKELKCETIDHWYSVGGGETPERPIGLAGWTVFNIPRSVQGDEREQLMERVKEILQDIQIQENIKREASPIVTKNSAIRYYIWSMSAKQQRMMEVCVILLLVVGLLGLVHAGILPPHSPPDLSAIN